MNSTQTTLAVALWVGMKPSVFSDSHPYLLYIPSHRNLGDQLLTGENHAWLSGSFVMLAVGGLIVDR